MRLEQFFEKFELFADAPNAVGKMRELVLDLAVTARLIPSEAEWAKRPLRSLVTKIGSGATPAGGRESYFNEGIPLIRSMNVHFRGFDRTGLVFLSKEQAGQLSNVVVQPGDVLLNITGASIGRVTIAPPEMAGARVNQHVTIIRPTSELLPVFLALFLASPSEQRMIDEIQVGATRQALTKGMIEQFEIPLPPIAEQERIVAKVDELMALCDRLEAQQKERDARHAALARASLTRFAEAPIPANLAFLFHKSYSISPADLRKTIFTLAVQGRLVPQNPDEEPALALIDQIAARKIELSKERKFRGSISVVPMAPEEGGFELPLGWMLVRFGEIMFNRDGERIPISKEERSTKAKVFDYYGASGVIDKIDSYLFDKPLLLIGEDGANLINRSTPIAFMARGKYWVNNHAHVLDGLSEGFLRYIELHINAINLQSYVTGSAQPKMNQAKMNSIPIALPPLAEQHRIVAKVDQLMAMVDKLEIQLAAAKAKSAALLDAVIHELLNPSAEIVDLAAYSAAVACYAIRKMQDKPYFGRTAAMKLFYLAQAHVGLELGLRPMRDAAGPLDQWIYDFEKEGVREDWFRVSEGNIASGKKKIAYQPGRRLAAQCTQAERLLSASQRKEYDRLLELFVDRTTEEAEIIATLFAAWNDFLIDGHAPSDDQIVTEVREHWHEKKGRFTPKVLRQWLAWLRQNNLVPTGRLPHTAHQPQLLLN